MKPVSETTKASLSKSCGISVKAESGSGGWHPRAHGGMLSLYLHNRQKGLTPPLEAGPGFPPHHSSTSMGHISCNDSEHIIKIPGRIQRKRSRYQRRYQSKEEFCSLSYLGLKLFPKTQLCTLTNLLEWGSSFLSLSKSEAGNLCPKTLCISQNPLVQEKPNLNRPK